MAKASRFLALYLIVVFVAFVAIAETMEEEFKIEGLISPASPKALESALEESGIKVIGLNLKNTKSGWPVLRVQFDSEAVSKDKIKQIIASTADPAGHNYKVHEGPLLVKVPLIEEEQKAIAILGTTPNEMPQIKNPIPASEESVSQGQKLYVKNCAKCHGLSGNGHGPSAHAFSTWPRQLWVWNNAGPTIDGYLFWFITNGRTDMPPWGVVLSENERWNLVNYIKTIKAPETE